MTREDNEKLKQEMLRKVKLLKAKADDPSVGEAESAVYLEKIQELLAKYGLEMAQLPVDEQPEHTEHEYFRSDWNNSPARRHLAVAVCRYFMVSPLINKKKGAPWTLIGKKSNIVEAKEMCSYLMKTTVRLSNQWGKQNPGGNTIDFRRGCFARLTERVRELRLNQERQAAPIYTPTGNPGNLPALVRSEAQLNEGYISRLWPNLRTISLGRVRQGNAAMEGRAAGDKIGLHRQVTGGSGTRLLTGGKK